MADGTPFGSYLVVEGHDDTVIMAIDGQAPQRPGIGGMSSSGTGQKVSIKLDAFPNRVFEGTINEISRAEMKFAPKSLTTMAGGELPAVTDPKTGQSRPMSTSYTARVALDDPEGVLQIGLRGRGKIHTGSQPLGGRIWRSLSHTFHFWL